MAYAKKGLESQRSDPNFRKNHSEKMIGREPHNLGKKILAVDGNRIFVSPDDPRLLTKS